MSPALRVLRSLLTTVQDEGRPALQRFGVPVAGAMDGFALAVANRLLGNPAGAAALEISAGGTAFEVLEPLAVAIAGADLGAQVGGRPLAPWTTALARPGEQLVFPGRGAGWGARAYLAVPGGFEVPTVLGSRSTCLSGGFGGLDGRPLRPGDTLERGESRADPLRLAGRRWPQHMRPAYAASPALRVILGPHAELFAPNALTQLAAEPFRVGQASNRMGYRLEGPALPYARPLSLPSLGVIPGAIQVPPDGAPILLMADAQPTGGYPIVAVVIGADMPLAAQLLPGDTLRFAPATLEAALAAQAEQRAWLGEAAPAADDDLYQLGWAGAPHGLSSAA